MPVRVEGIAQLNAAFKAAGRDVERKLLREDLKAAAEVVAVSGREKISRYRGARIGRLRPVVTNRAVFVRQSESKRTGLRGDFGSLQWRKLSEALDENEDKVREGLEDALDRINARADLT